MRPARGGIRLHLEDGAEFSGTSFGAALDRPVAGEVVFNTGMAGYVETLTDPSYRGQILVLTYPLQGNYGVPAARPAGSIDGPFESGRIQVQGLVVQHHEPQYSHHAGVRSLGAWLAAEGVPAIQGVDTRALTMRLREAGTMQGNALRGWRSYRGRPGPGFRGRDAPAGLRTGGAGLPGVLRPRGRTRGAARGRGRQGQHRPLARLPGRPGAPGLGARTVRRGGRQRRRDHARKRTRRSRRPPGTRAGTPIGDGVVPGPDLRRLPREPVARHGGGGPDLQAALRASQREPAGAGPRHRPFLHHQPEPRLRGGRRHLARRLGTVVPEPQRRHERRHPLACPAVPEHPVPPRGPSRSGKTPPTCSTPSSGNAPDREQSAAETAVRHRPRLGSAPDRPGRGVRLLRVPGHQGVQRGGRPHRPRESEHRDHPDQRGDGRPPLPERGDAAPGPAGRRG